MGSGSEASYVTVSQVNSLSYYGLILLYIRVCSLASTRGSFPYAFDYRNVCEFSILESFLVLPLAPEICSPFCVFSLSLLVLAVAGCLHLY